MKKSSILFSSLLVASLAHAGSFQLPTQGARQSAMGGSGTAYPWDVATLFYNPAGLARLNEFQFSGNVYFLNPNVRYAQTGTGDYFTDNIRKTSTPFAIYAGGKLNKEDAFGFGLGVYTPFGSSLNWGNDWRGRFLIQDISLKSIFFQPTVSYAISDVLSVGGGFIYAIGDMEINKALPLQDATGEGQANLTGKANGMGFNLGIHLQPNDNLYFGLNYRSGVNMKVENGHAKFRVPASVAANFPNTDFFTTLKLPDMITLGVAGKVTPDLTLQADLIYATWSRYTNLAFDFKQNTDNLLDTDDPRAYENTFAVRAGANYRVTNSLDIMAGFSYDPTPTQSHLLSPDVVDGDRIGFSAGVHLSPLERLHFTVQAAYLYVSPRTASYEPGNFSGEYQIKSFSPSIGITYKF